MREGWLHAGMTSVGHSREDVPSHSWVDLAAKRDFNAKRMNEIEHAQDEKRFTKKKKPQKEAKERKSKQRKAKESQFSKKRCRIRQIYHTKVIGERRSINTLNSKVL